jgi:3-dehydroquinate dehydratase I
VAIVVSTWKSPEDTDILAFSPDLIELRGDLAESDPLVLARSWCDKTRIPLIVTLRSRREGGRFAGSPDDWFRTVKPLVSCAAYVDIEQEYAGFAGFFRDHGVKIIASFHTLEMPPDPELQGLLSRLRHYGDIPKIVVGPGSDEDVLRFLSFTSRSGKPIVTSIMGEKYRHVRVLLPLFGSEFLFAHAGDPASPGQYHISDVREIYRRLGVQVPSFMEHP